jgi:uncharacterized membrane protein YeaQ/YmgE (transglycosylase-associated protein family)
MGICVTVTDVVGALAVGIVIGVVGRLVLPGRRRGTGWLTVAAGPAGAVLGGLLARQLGVTGTPGIDWLGVAIEIGLAVAGVTLVAGMTSRSPAH